MATLIEWTLAIFLISKVAEKTKIKAYNWLAIAMLPNLASAMAAITWHIYDNSEKLIGLVVIQAILTTLGNICLAIAALHLLRTEKKKA
ncbi:hypothetical protein EV05_1700 [Prochlorococcus sp. MIT 0601]|nr:hypothetical protein EV05_1700 [Prochlorococcus sp. MIT 0601]